MNDYRADAARYYGLGPSAPNDLPFYLAAIPSPQARILELGCGTGRVLVPLASSCAFIQGIDHSEPMLARCRKGMRQAGLAADQARVAVADISTLDLAQRFDLIIAPFRVMQNLETAAQVDGFFATIRRHLAPDGSCILNVFRPYRDRETLLQEWSRQEEVFEWEVPIEGDRLTCHCWRRRVCADPLVIYPDLIYRRYRGDEQIDEAVLRICMRCYYADEFLALISGQGFHIIDTWGGYAGELYGEGPELVVQFGLG